MKLRIKPGTGPFDLDHFYYLDIIVVIVTYVVIFGGAVSIILLHR